MNVDIICPTHFTWFIDESNSGGAVCASLLWRAHSEARKGRSNSIFVAHLHDQGSAEHEYCRDFHRFYDALMEPFI